MIVQACSGLEELDTAEIRVGRAGRVIVESGDQRTSRNKIGACVHLLG
jgi:hypothetical protein